MWDDATTRIAGHRLLRNIPDNEPGIGPRPNNPDDAARWQHLMLRLLEDGTWLTNQPTPTVEPLPHATPHEPDAVRTVLDHLRDYAPDADEREDRNLAELARQEVDRDPVRRLETRLRDLRELGRNTVSSAEQEALHLEVVNLDRELRHARREHTIEQAFDRYTANPIDDARTARITTLAHDTLTHQPAWMIDHIRHLHDHRQLAATDTAQLATRIITTAAYLDIHGQLPPTWPAPPEPAIHAAQPGIEVKPGPCTDRWNWPTRVLRPVADRGLLATLEGWRHRR